MAGVGKTALLEFKLVRSPEEQRALFQRLDSWLASRGASAGGDTALAKTPLTGLMIDAGSFNVQVPPSRVDALKPYVGKEIVFGVRPEDIFDSALSMVPTHVELV